jgi:hypothetical protein
VYIFEEFQAVLTFTCANGCEETEDGRTRGETTIYGEIIDKQKRTNGSGGRAVKKAMNRIVGSLSFALRSRASNAVKVANI